MRMISMLKAYAMTGRYLARVVSAGVVGAAREFSRSMVTEMNTISLELTAERVELVRAWAKRQAADLAARQAVDVDHE